MSTKAEILKLREAFFKGAVFGKFSNPSDDDQITTQARRLYPLPKSERPRVIEVTVSPRMGNPMRLRLTDGMLEHSWGGDTSGKSWYDTFEMLSRKGSVTPDDRRRISEAWASLLKQPTELVEDDA